MEEWRKVRLGDCIREINERTTVNNQYEVLTSSKNGIFSQEEYFDKQVASKDNIGYKIIKKGQFTYRSMSDSGSFTINRLENKEIGIVSPAYPVFEAVDINGEYLKYFFESSLFKQAIHNLSQGSTRTALKYKDLSDIEVLIPSTKEQENIVKILNNIDKIIQKIDKQKENNKRLQNRIFKNCIKEYSKKKVEFSEIATFKQGYQIENQYLLKNNKNGYLRYLYIQDFFSDKNILYAKDNEKYEKIELNDIAIVNTGATSGNSYRGKYGILSNNMFKVKIAQGINEDYIWYFLQSEEYWNQLKKYFNSAGQPHVGHKNIAKITVPIINKKNEENLVNLLKKLERKKELIEWKSCCYIKLKKALTQQLLTGRLLVKL